MTYRKCRNPHTNQGNLSHQEIVELAMKKLGWTRQKVLSWLEKENASLKKARPRELVDRGQTDKIVELLDKRESDRIKEENKRKFIVEGIPDTPEKTAKRLGLSRKDMDRINERVKPIVPSYKRKKK